MSIENKRLEAVISFLLKMRMVKNQTDFSKKVSYDTGSLTKIIDGKRGYSDGLKWKIYDTFRISKAYLFEGADEITIEPEQEEIQEGNELEKLKALVKMLKNTVKSQEITIKSQEITIDVLQKQLVPKIKYIKKPAKTGKSK